MYPHSEVYKKSVATTVLAKSLARFFGSLAVFVQKNK